jgi:hypothetical protein
VSLTGMWGHLAHSAPLQPSPPSESITPKGVIGCSHLFFNFIGLEVGGSVSYHASVLFSCP